LWCWSEQVSSQPSIFWLERHKMPLAIDSPFTPIRGRVCLDDSCLRLEDAEDMSVADYRCVAAILKTYLERWEVI
jgi:hypothetical protein